VMQALFRGAAGRREKARRLQALLEVLIPQAEVLQRWWRIVLSEKMLRKVRSVVDRYTAEHRLLMREFLGMRTAYGDGAPGAPEALSADQRFLTSSQFSNRPKDERPGKAAPLGGGKRFEMWVSLKVGLADDATEGEPSAGGTRRRSVSQDKRASASQPDAATAEPLPAFAGYQVFSARSATLKKGGLYFAAFFSDPTNVDTKGDDGHYLIRRSWKHFDAILEYIRDGSVALPTAYVPKTYDNRPPSTEQEELLEFLREAHFYGIKPLVDEVIPKLIQIRYGSNPKLVALLKARGVLL